MRGVAVAVAVAVAAALLLAGACGDRSGGTADGEREGGSEGATKQTPASASKRMLGKWRMDLSKVPDTALTDEFRKLKRSGQAAAMRIEYTVTPTEFVLEKSGAGGRVQERWYYEVLSENGDALMLERTDNSGQKQKIPASVEGGKLRIGTGNGIVPLERVGG